MPPNKATHIARPGRISAAEALRLLTGAPTAELMARADRIRQARHGRRTYFTHSLNLNPTNLCENRCELCAFWRESGSPEAYLIDPKEARKRLSAARGKGLTDLHIVGGVTPALGLGYYEKLLALSRRLMPEVLVQGLTAVEVEYLARLETLSVTQVLVRLQRAGLGAIPGGGAEIFNPAVRKRVCSNKISAETWLDIHRQAHAIGLPTNATMLFGHLESAADIVDHMDRLRQLQDQTGGFGAFIALPFHPKGTRLDVQRGPGGDCIARVVALGRIFLDNFAHVRVLANYMDRKLLGVLTAAGADDVGGTSLDERIARAAGGAEDHRISSVEEMMTFLASIGLEPVLVNSAYDCAGQNSEARGQRSEDRGQRLSGMASPVLGGGHGVGGGQEPEDGGQRRQTDMPRRDEASSPLRGALLGGEAGSQAPTAGGITLSRLACGEPPSPWRERGLSAMGQSHGHPEYREAMPPGMAMPPNPQCRKAMARAAGGVRLTAEDAVILHDCAPLGELGALAHARRMQAVPARRVTFVIDRNLSFTNVCQAQCRFCAFHVKPGAAGAFTMSIEQIVNAVVQAAERGATQVLLQGGLNPELDLAFFERLFRAVKCRTSVWLHSLSPTEVLWLAGREGLTIEQTLKRLRAAGLDSLPGGGAEILVDEVRRRVSPHKISADHWFAVMEAAQKMGMSTTATMVYGLGETAAQRVAHLLRVRQLQDRTGGFKAFIPWSFQPNRTDLPLPAQSGLEYLRMVALARLVLDNVPHVQAGWVTEGPDVAQLALSFGADDWGGVLMEEKVVRATGVAYDVTVGQIVSLIAQTGMTAAQRTTQYQIIRRFARGPFGSRKSH